MSNMSNMSIAELERTGLLYAIPVLPQEIRTGLITCITFGCISLFSTTSLLTYLSYTAIKKRIAARQGGVDRSSVPVQGFFWLVNLFCADFVHGLGSIVGNQVARNSLYPGWTCNAEAVLLQLGVSASACWAFVIACYTFVLLVGRPGWKAWVIEKSNSGKARWVLCVGVWSCLVFLATIVPVIIRRANPDKGPFYNNVGVGWCWIEPDYFWERIFFVYPFFFLNCFALTSIYCALFVYIRVVAWRVHKATSTNGSGGHPRQLRSWQKNLEGGTATSPPDSAKRITVTRTLSITTEDRPLRRPQIAYAPNHTNDRLYHVSKVLLCYPLVYICLTLPTAIIRLGQFAGRPWGLTAAFVAADINLLSGFCNVILYTTTRKGMVPWNKIYEFCGCHRGKSKNSTNGVSSYGWDYTSGSYNAEFNSTVQIELPPRLVTKSSVSSVKSEF